MAEETFPVKVYIYDISKGMAKSMSPMFLGKQIDGIWHTGIVVYGQEFFFGGGEGIMSCRPCGTILGQPEIIHDLGNTQIPYEMFKDYLKDLSNSSFRGDTYHLLEHNCNNFSSEAAQFLTGKDIPSYVTNLPAEVMNTPMRQMIKPMIDSMSVSPSGGENLFPERSAAAASPHPPGPGVSKPKTDLSSKDSDKELCPLFKKLEIGSIKSEEISSSGISEGDKQLLEEIREYITTEDCSWSLGKTHLQLIDKCLETRVHQSTVCQYLQAMSGRDDVVLLAVNDGSNTILKILNRFDSLDNQSRHSLAATLVNMCSSDRGHRYMTGSAQIPTSTERTAVKLTSDVCVTCLLTDDQTTVNIGATLAYNLCRYKITDDLMVELSSAVLQALQSEHSEDTVYCCLTSLYRFIQKSNEVRALASIMEIDWNRIKKVSRRIADLVSSIVVLIS